MNAIQLETLVASTAKPRGRRRWLRFSLRSLLLSVFFCGCVMLVWRNRAPWVEIREDVHKTALLSAEFLPDGMSLLLQNQSGQYAVLNIESGEQSAHFSPEENYAVAVHAESPNRVMLLGCRGSISAWDGSKIQSVGKLKGCDGVQTASISRDGRRAVVFTDAGKVRLYDMNSGDELDRPEGLEALPVDFAVIGPDGKTVLTIEDSEPCLARIWNVESRQQVLKFPVDGVPLHACFSCDGKSIIMAYPGAAFTWNSSTGIGESTKIASDCVSNWVAAFSPDSQRIVTLDARRARLWARDGTPLGFLSGEDANFAAFSPDGTRAIEVLGKKTRIWERRRPERAGGIAVLPEFWLSFVMLAVTLVSLRADWRG